jgi:hypothetical protein
MASRRTENEPRVEPARNSKLVKNIKLATELLYVQETN